MYKIISKGIPYPLGAFKNSRTFISVDNVVFLINEIIKKHTEMKGGVYHITDDEPLSTQKIIEIIRTAKGKKPLILSPPKFLINVLAKFGDMISLPINSKRLKKMTSNLIVSNQKIKTALKTQALGKRTNHVRKIILKLGNTAKRIIVFISIKLSTYSVVDLKKQYNFREA